MKRFLIVKTSSIGDVLQCVHLLPYLKQRFPHASIDWVVEKSIAPILRAHPEVDQVLEVDTKLWRRSLFQHRKSIELFRKILRKSSYDVLFDLQGNTKSGLITMLAKAQKKVGYGWNSVAEKPNYFSTNIHLPISQTGNVRSRYAQMLANFFGEDIPDPVTPMRLKLTHEEETRFSRLKQLCFQRPRLMICFGANWKNKRLPEATLKEFLHMVNEAFSPSFFFIYSNQEEKEQADRLEREFASNSHAVGDLSLPLLQSFMAIVEGVIAADSAALHLCATTKTPSFSFFGPSSALVYKPIGPHHTAFQGTCPYQVQFEKRCPQLRTCETGACLSSVTPEILFKKFHDFWAKVAPQEYAQV